MREGRFGVCEFTGKVIPHQRLEAIPWARYTVEAQAEMEGNGDAPRAHLNKLDSLDPQRLESQHVVDANVAKPTNVLRRCRDAPGMFFKRARAHEGNLSPREEADYTSIGIGCTVLDRTPRTAFC